MRTAIRSRAIQIAVAVLLVAPPVLSSPSAHAEVNSGDVDPTFGVDGVLTLDFAPWILISRYDGSFYAVGASEQTSDQAVFVQHRNWDGSLATSFGVSGTATLSYPSVPGWGQPFVADAQVLDDGSILLAQQVYMEAERGRVTYEEYWVLSRLTPRGYLDPAFGDGGSVVINPVGHAHPYLGGMTIGAKGSVVLVGTVFSRGHPRRLSAYAFHRNGSPLRRFGDDGRVLFCRRVCYTTATDVLSLPSGRLIISGDFGHPILAAFRMDGSLDRTFGHNGFAGIGVPRLHTEIGFGLLSRWKDRLVVALGDGYGSRGLAGFLDDGRLDPFMGVTTVAPPRPYDYVWDPHLYFPPRPNFGIDGSIIVGVTAIGAGIPCEHGTAGVLGVRDWDGRPRWSFGTQGWTIGPCAAEVRAVVELNYFRLLLASHDPNEIVAYVGAP